MQRGRLLKQAHERKVTPWFALPLLSAGLSRLIFAPCFSRSEGDIIETKGSALQRGFSSRLQPSDGAAPRAPLSHLNGYDYHTCAQPKCNETLLATVATRYFRSNREATSEAPARGEMK